jgi:hypothetical protein
MSSRACIRGDVAEGRGLDLGGVSELEGESGGVREQRRECNALGWLVWHAGRYQPPATERWPLPGRLEGGKLLERGRPDVYHIAEEDVA